MKPCTQAALTAAANRGPRAIAALLLGESQSHSLRLETIDEHTHRVTTRRGLSYRLRWVVGTTDVEMTED